jgi:iron complex outermembrane receptor protein
MLVSAGGGNVEQGFLNWRYGGGGDRFHYRLYGKGFTRGPQFHQDRRNFDDWRMGQAGFRFDWEKSDRDTVTVLGDTYGTLAGSKLNISSLSPPAIEAVEANGTYYGQNLSAIWQRSLASGGSWQMQAYYDRTDRQDLNYREVRHTIDATLIHRMPLERNRISWGLGVRASPSIFTRTTDAVNFIPHRQTYTIYTGFLENEFVLVPNRFSLTGGVKLLHNSFSGFEVQPSVQFAWTPTAKDTLWGAVTRAVRTPSRIEEGFEFNALLNPALPLFVRLVGDGQFSSEKLNGYELGYRRFFQRQGFFSIAAFHNRYDDLLSVESRDLFVEQPQDSRNLILPLYFRNGVRAATSGIEPSVLWELRPWWRLRSSYSLMLLDAKNKSTSIDLSTVGQLEGDSSRHKLVVRSSFQLPRQFELDLTYRYVSSVTNQNVPAYSTGDIRLAWLFRPQLELSVTGRNLFQPYHVEYGDNPGPLVGIRRGALVKLTWRQ